MEENAANDYDNKHYIAIMLSSSIFILIYIIYLSLIISYIIKNYHKKKLSVYWFDYCCLILTSIIFIIIYIIYLVHSEKDRINDPTKLSQDFLSISIIVSLVTMCLTIIGTLFFDAITAINLSSKMNQIKKIIEQDLEAVSLKFKNIKINNILEMKYTYKYYIIFLIIYIIYITLCIIAYTDTNIQHFRGYFLTLYNYFTYLLRFYHFIVLTLLLLSIIIMNKRKKSLLRKYYYNPNRIAQKVYDSHFSQIVYFTDIISFKLVSDLIMNVPPLFFLSLEKFNRITLIFSEFTIFIFIFLGGSENLILDKYRKAGIINKQIKFWFCLKKFDFHFGEKDHRTIFDEFQYNYSKEEQNILNDLNLTIIKNIENDLIESEDKSNFLNEERNSLSEINSNNSLNRTLSTNKKKIELKTVSEFYLIQKLIMLFFKTNKKVYESAMENIEENIFEIKKYGQDKKNKNIIKNTKNKDNFISNVDRLSRMSIKDIRKIKPSIKIMQNAIFTSIEEKEIFEELKRKLDLKNEKYTYKIESLFSSQLFELFPFYQMKINSILRALNPSRNINIINKFVKRNNNSQNSFIITNQDNRISIRNSILSNKIDGSKKELEKNLYYTYDLYLMYEIYDKIDFINFDELEKIISEYNAYLLSVIKNMNYSFLPLILGIFSLEIYDSHKIIILYRNPLHFTNFNHFNHWINFYITEEPEKIRVSSLFNDVIDVNEIEIRDSLQLNEGDYDEVKKILENDYNFLRKINNIFPIIHLFIGDETSEDNDKQINKDEVGSQKIKNNQNQYNENSILGDSINKDIGLVDALDKNLSSSNFNNTEEFNEINNIIGENSLFDKEYYYMSGKEIRTIKIYFTNLFRKDCALNKCPENIHNQINSDSYCEFLQNQLIRYLRKNSLFNDEEKNENENENEIIEENK